MLIASLGILTAAIARVPLDFLQAGGLPAFFAATDVLILVFVAVDTFRNRRLHPAMIAGVLVIVGSQAARFLIAGTPQWTQFARWLIT
jgi:preprotein translocase subunit SecY